VSWALGHLVELAGPHEYDPGLKKWSIESLPIIPGTFKLKPVQGTEKHLKILKDLVNSREISLIINACDAGREGELIFRRIITWCKCKKNVKRLWLSEATPAAVKKAFNSLREGSDLDNLAAAAEARAKADWLVGLNATRAFSVRHNAVLSVGRVQTPTLALIVNREREINNFRPETYWEVWATFQKKDGGIYRGKWISEKKDRLTGKNEAETIARKTGSSGEVTRVEQKEKREQPPQLFSLNELQKEANKRHGLTAQETLEAAQALYERYKLLTYPRTDSRYLTEALVRDTLSARLAALASAPEYASLVPGRLTELGNRYVNDSKVTDHHAIIPTAARPDLARLTSNEYNIYDLVARRFLAIFYPDACYAVTEVITVAGEETYLSKGKVEIEPGWKTICGGDIGGEHVQGNEEEDRQSLPSLAQGDQVSVQNVETTEKKTRPPARYTEATLLAAMENAGRLVDDKEMAGILKESGGLGTPATRAAIIERLIKVGYILRQKKYLVPTTKGVTLINLVPEQVKSPLLTARWEQGLVEIEKGKEPVERWMEGIIEFTRDVVGLAAKQEVSRRTGSINGNQTRIALGKCPLCECEVAEYPKSYRCTGYREGCTFVIWKVIAGKKISLTQAKILLKNGSTGRLKGFKSKAKKPFEASLVIDEEGKVIFDFGNGR